MKKTFKSALSLFCAMLTVCMTLAPCAMAANDLETPTYGDVTGYNKPTSVESVQTSTGPDTTDISKAFPWTYDAQNKWLISGNANHGSSRSVLKIEVKGSGALVFQYKVSAPYGEGEGNTNWESNPDSFYFWLNNKDNVNKTQSYMTGYVEKKHGEIDWSTGSVSVTTGDDETSTIYLMYKKNGTGEFKIADCVWIKDIEFYSGNVSVTPSSSDISCGTVSGEKTDVPAGTKVTVTATPKDGCKFYGWSIDGKLVSSDLSYTFNAYGDLSPVAYFGKESEIVAQNLVTGKIYNDLAEAINGAKSGDKVMPLSDCELNSNATLVSGAELYVPYNSDYDSDACTDCLEKGGSVTQSDVSTCLATSDKTYCKVTVKNGVILTVYGKLSVGGVIGYPSRDYQGHTSGAHGKIVNNGTISVKSGGVLDCYGFIEGSGEVTAESGSTVYEPFVVYDFSGGKNTDDLNSNGQSPFAQYTMQNISCDFYISCGAELMGRCNLYASSNFNKTDAVIIGEGGLTSLKNGAVLHRTVDKNKHCGDYCPDLGKVTYSIDGGAEFNCLSMTVLNTPVTTKGILFPIPYGYDYVLNNGTYDIDTDLVVMPGAVFTVGSDATLNVNDRFVVLDGLKQNDMSEKSYPTTDMLKNAGYPQNGVLIVNGTMNVNNGVTFLGIVQTENKNAKIKTGTGCVFSGNVTLGAKTTYGNNTSILPLSARVMTNGKLTVLESEKNYHVSNLNGWTLDKYKVTVIDKYEEITVNQSAKGSFEYEHHFDKQVVSNTYLKSAATCKSPAVYYYSCECGEHSTTKTFTFGDKADHSYNNGKCIYCGQADPNDQGGSTNPGGIAGFFSSIINAIRDFFARIFSIFKF